MGETKSSDDGLDRERLEEWFRASVPGAEPPLRYERIAGGRSNLTYRVSDGDGGRWILRRPPLGTTLGSAHDMGRERTRWRRLDDRSRWHDRSVSPTAQVASGIMRVDSDGRLGTP